ncbi:MAG: hypothetical protein BWY72_02029 [Bacteroidetes bacterium ADurb.Bin416]|nr:MAG: hypothetical protein BWY72_02029 [Bacteroidetes bacterium ADurb.Bin416]
MALASGLYGSYGFTPEGYSMMGGQGVNPDSGQVLMFSRAPNFSSSRYCLVAGPNDDQMEMESLAFRAWISSIMCWGCE